VVMGEREGTGIQLQKVPGLNEKKKTYSSNKGGGCHQKKYKKKEISALAKPKGRVSHPKVGGGKDSRTLAVVYLS